MLDKKEATLKLDNYLRIKEACEFIGITQECMRDWGRKGIIPTYRHPISKYRLYLKKDLEEFKDKKRVYKD